MPSGRRFDAPIGVGFGLSLGLFLHVATATTAAAKGEAEDVARGHKRRKVNKYCSTKCDQETGRRRSSEGEDAAPAS